MPVPAALRAVHGVLGEDAVEHVGAVDLAGEVAVVARVVAAEEVAEGRLPVAWMVLVGGFLGRGKRGEGWDRVGLGKGE